MTTVVAYAAPAAKAPLERTTIERREVGEHDVLIDIKFVGICHSDIHQAREGWGEATFPMVPGHEIAADRLRGRLRRHQVQGRRPCGRRLPGRLLPCLRQLQGRS